MAGISEPEHGEPGHGEPGHGEPALSLAEWLVLCVVCEERRHGFAIARLLDADGSLGRIWRVPKPVVYRSVQRLEQLGLARTAALQPSHQGPAKSPVEPTPAGRRMATAWLDRPAGHNRDVRSELLVKLALIDRAGGDPGTLIEAQHEQLGPVAQALRQRLTTATGFERTLVLWRTETVSATLRFLEAMREHDLARTPAGGRPRPAPKGAQRPAAQSKHR